MKPTTAVVTGASAGIGRELTRQLVQDRGMTVLATGRRLDRLEALANELPGGQVMVLAGDLVDPDFRARLWDRAEAMPGGVDVLVNNAAFGHYAAFADQDFAVINAMIEVNVLALMDLTQRAIRHMKVRGSGQIVQISSTLGFLGLPESATYVATKHAVNGLVKSLRYELRGTGVKVWAACPNRTESEFFAVASGQGGEPIPARYAEPTDRVVRGILHGLDRNRRFVFPTWRAWGLIQLAHWLPGPYEWVMERVARTFIEKQFNVPRKT